MNRRLIDPFQSLQLPEIIEEYLDQGITTCQAFNRRGTLLAAGTHDGLIVIYDWDTRGVAATLIGHIAAVTSVSWSRNSRYLASVANDAQVMLWDVTTAEPIYTGTLPCQGYLVSLSPKPPYKAVISLVEGPPLLRTLAAEEENQELPLLSETDFGQDVKQEGLPSAVGCFTKRGDMIIVGYAKGPSLITVLETKTLKFLDVVKVPNATRVTGLTMNRKGNLVLANCRDRTLRLYDLDPVSLTPEARHKESPLKKATQAPPARSLDEVKQALASVDYKASKGGSLLGGSLLSPRREFADKVERCKWGSAAFSPDSEHIVAAALSKTQHHIYIWGTYDGKMERILEGKEGTGSVSWHPLGSCVCSQTWPSGKIFIWARAYAENWSAFAPDFKELDENAQYCEQEDEFDWQTPGATGHHDVLVARERQGNAAAGVLGLAQAEGDCGPVDIVSVAPDWVFSSDEEDPPGDQLHHLPVVVQPAIDDDDDGEGSEDGQEERDAAGQENGDPMDHDAAPALQRRDSKQPPAPDSP